MKFGLLSPLMKKYLTIYAERAFVVLCLNKGAIKNLLDAGVERKKLARCNWGTWGADTEEFTPKRNGSEPEYGRMILFVGWLSEAKGVPYLLPAFKKVKKLSRKQSL